MFEDWLKKSWLKPLSILIVFVILLYTSLQFFPKTEEESFVPFIICISVFAAVFLGYIIYYLFKNFYYPKAKKMQNGILFVFHTQDEKTFDDAKYNIVEKFKGYMRSCMKDFDLICLNVNKIKDYDFSNNKTMIALLERVNCMICIDVDYQVDDVNNTDNYLIRINPGVFHPEFNKQDSEFFLNEMAKVYKPIKSMGFSKQQKINKMNFTSEYLSYAVEYIVGLIAQLDNNVVLSLKMFENLYNSEPFKTQNWMANEIKKGYYYSCMMVAKHIIIGDYFNNWSVSVLDEAEKFIGIMNEIFPDTYEYNEMSAIINFSKYRNISKAKENIKRCREIDEKRHWVYNEAFLNAYTSNDLGSVYSIYIKAVLSDYSISKVIEFIEKVLEEEPEKTMLHFALGFLYNENKDSCLSFQHLKTFSEKFNYKECKNRKCVEFIDSILKRKTDCNICQNDDCTEKKKAS